MSSKSISKSVEHFLLECEALDGTRSLFINEIIAIHPHFLKLSKEEKIFCLSNPVEKILKQYIHLSVSL